MKKVIKIILFIICIILVTGCGNKSSDSKKDLLPRPVSDTGSDIVIRDLKFYLPSKFVSKEGNGENGIYEFYTGEYVEFGPTGIDVYINHQIVGGGFDIEEYATKKSSGAVAKGTMERVTINEYEWFKARVKEDYYYCTITPEGVYDIHIRKYEDSENLYDDTIKMFEETLFVENRETN